MRISSKTDYALSTLLYLAQHCQEGVLPTAAIAAAQGIPVKFLEQILLALKGAGFVVSKRGAKGGYYLATDAEEITLAAVVRVTEGQDVLTTQRRPASDGRPDWVSPFTDVWRELDAETNRRLEHITLADMVRRERELNPARAPEYAI